MNNYTFTRVGEAVVIIQTDPVSVRVYQCGKFNVVPHHADESKVSITQAMASDESGYDLIVPYAQVSSPSAVSRDELIEVLGAMFASSSPSEEVSVNNFPTIQDVQVINFPNPQQVAGAVKRDFTGFGNGAHSTATVNGTSIEVLALNANRNGLMLRNSSIGTMYVKFGPSPASAASHSVELAAGAYFEAPEWAARSSVQAIKPSGGAGTLQITTF